MSVIVPSSKEQIIRVGERLFARHGVDGVSLRQIGAAAGNGNNSAVQYHFGSKDRLIGAIFEYRLPRLHGRRALLIEERRPHDLRSWVECQLRAVLEQSELDDSHYMAFVAMLYQHGRRDLFEGLPAEFLAAAREYRVELEKHATHIPVLLRTHRIARAMALIVHAASDRERARCDGRAVLPFAVELGDLLDGMVGFLQAPVSAASLAAVEGLDPTETSSAMFL